MNSNNPKTSKIPCLCIAGTHSGSGKTTISLGIMAAFTKRGFKVQPFKVGPDFIDPGHHSRSTGRVSHNLDGWMMDRECNRKLFERHLTKADIAIVEGVMGLYDGFSGSDESGSTAQMAKWLNLPVILVIDAKAMARSAAAIALGFSIFDPDLSLKGVIFNRVSSPTHKDIIKEAMAAIPQIPIIGFLPTAEELHIPSRHLGLITDEDFAPDKDYSNSLSSWIERHLDLDQLLDSVGDYNFCDSFPTPPSHGLSIKIGVARDEAFSFYYPENLRLLKKAGAELVFFSPLRDSELPHGIKGLIFGGGYPELHCRTLSQNQALLRAVKAFSLKGGPVYAECGGLMYLGKNIKDLSGKTHTMANIFPIATNMSKGIKALGYREITTNKESILGPAGIKARGHEFHYSNIEEKNNHWPRQIYLMRDRKTNLIRHEGFNTRSTLGSYVHLHWGSNPQIAKNFVAFCQRINI